MTKRLIHPVLSILLALSLALIMFQPVRAQGGIPPRDDVPAGQTIEGDMLLFGQNVTVDGKITGDLFAEAFVLWHLLAGTSLTIRRALAAFAASISGAGLLFFTSMMPDHVPPRMTYHFFWLLSATAISMGTVLTLAAAHLARFLVGSRQSSG